MLPSIVEKDSWFDQQIGIENSGIVNGDEYKAGVRSNSSHPFYAQSESMGVVEYSGHVFHVPLLFDVHQSVLILKYKEETGASRFIELDTSNVSAFRIDKSVFKKIGNKGFYHVLVESPGISLFAQRAKKLELKSGVAVYVWFNAYYIVINDEWKVLRNKGSVKKIFKDKEKQRAVTDFIRDQRIRVRKFNDDQLVRLILFCNDLYNKPL